MLRTAAFSSSLGEGSGGTVLIGASLFFFAMMKEQCGLPFINLNLRCLTSPYAFYKKQVVPYLKIFNLLRDEFEQFQLCLHFIVLLSGFSSPSLQYHLRLSNINDSNVKLSLTTFHFMLRILSLVSLLKLEPCNDLAFSFSEIYLSLNKPML